MSFVDDVFESSMRLFSEFFADGNFSIVRPDYASPVSLERTIFSNIGIPIDPGSTKAFPSMSGVEYFTIGLAPSRVEVGDVLIPKDSRKAIGIYTIQNKDGGGKDIVAFRTNEIGYIAKTKRLSDSIFQNFRFGLVNSPSPDGPLQEIDGSNTFEVRQICFFSRANISKGLYLHAFKRPWVIRSVTADGPISVATISENVK